MRWIALVWSILVLFFFFCPFPHTVNRPISLGSFCSFFFPLKGQLLFSPSHSSCHTNTMLARRELDLSVSLRALCYVWLAYMSTSPFFFFFLHFVSVSSGAAGRVWPCEAWHRNLRLGGTRLWYEGGLPLALRHQCGIARGGRSRHPAGQVRRDISWAWSSSWSGTKGVHVNMELKAQKHLFYKY